MFDNAKFKKLVAESKSTGEVVAADRFLVTARGLGGVPVGAKVMFENGNLGLVRSVQDQTCIILNLSAETIPLGMLIVMEDDGFETGVGEALIGRIVSPLLHPLDGQGAVRVTSHRPVFAEAPGITKRAMLDTQLVSGVTVVDTLFPLVLGQRIAILGDSKAGKSSFTTQLAITQAATDRIVIYALIGKRRVDVDNLIAQLNHSGAIKHSVVVTADSFSPLPQAYLAPYVACALAEFFWEAGRDVIVIYDDLSSHAKIYRELSLLSRISPGRDSYPGDMFYAHSSLLERAGKLVDKKGTLTALPVVLTPSDDITAYLPTNIMSITDGQIIFDLESFRRGIRPAVNVGLSVSRVGSRVQPKPYRDLGKNILRKLAAYRQAESFSHFGSEMALQTRADLELGKMIYEAFKQPTDMTLGLVEQRLILEVIIRSGGQRVINMSLLREEAQVAAGALSPEGDFNPLVEQLLAKTVMAGPA